MPSSTVFPRPYYMETFGVDAVLVRDNTNGTIHAVHGPKVTIWIGVNGATLVGSNAKTQRVKHLRKCSFLGFFLGNEFTQWDVEANTLDK